MEELNNLIQSDPSILISSLDTYQSEIIQSFLISTDNNYIGCADKWLNASVSNTAQFGGDGSRSKLYREKVFEEIEKFLCGDSKYDGDRNKLAESADKTQKYAIGVMSIAIGNVLGTAGTFIAPVIVLLIISIGKVAINAWCEMRKEIRTNE